MPDMTRITLLSFAAFTIIAAASGFAQIKGNDPGAVFNHQALHVRDMPKSTAFYENVLGLKRIPDPFNDDLHAFFQTGGQSELHLIGGAKTVEQQDIDHHMAFSVSSIDDFIERLRSMKVTYFNTRSEEGQVTTRPDGIKQVYFKDPDGYWLEVNDLGRSR